MKSSILIVLIFVSNFLSSLAVERLLQPYNLNFEEGITGGLPEGWFLATKFEISGFKAFTNTKDAFKGKSCLEFHYIGIADTSALQDTAEMTKDSYGFIYQSVDAKDYRGKRIKFKVAIFCENMKDSAHFRLRLTAHFGDDKSSQNFIGDSIFVKEGWNYYEIAGDIDNDANMLNYGVLLTGLGYILIDDASIEYVNDIANNNVMNYEELKSQELENLTAFSKLLGYVRYFYPGLEVEGIDWERFALTGVEYIEPAKDKLELIDRLKRLYLPIAPGIEITTELAKIKTDNAKPKDALDGIALSWLHKGAKLGIPIKNFSNELRNIYLPTRDREAPAIQIIDALPLRGKTIRFGAYIKTDVYPLEGHAQLWLGIDDADENVVVFTTSIDEKPITDTEWTKNYVEVEVPADASVIRLALVMLGDGKIWFDNIELQVIEKDKVVGKNYSKNNDFEAGETGDLIPGWTFPESAVKAGYGIKKTNSEKYQGKASLMIYSDEKTRIVMPKLNEHIVYKLVNDVYVNMPLNCYVDSLSTLPKPEFNSRIPDFKSGDFVMNSKDRYSKFAVTSLLWNVYRHFAIGIDEKINWDEILKTNLARSATDNDKDFIKTLNLMLAQINDGQGKAWFNTNEVSSGLPLLWRWVGNDLVVYQSPDSTLGIPVGTVIKTINKKPVSELVKDISAQIASHTEQWKKLRIAAILRSGSENEIVEIQVLTPDKQIKDISLTRNSNLFDMYEIRPPQIHIFKDNEYYIDLTRITERGMKNLVNELKDQLPKAKSIIFDLRGYTNLSEEFLGMFLNNNVQSVSRKYPVFTKPEGKPCTYLEFTSEIVPKNPYVKTNVYFLIDERTAGGSEIIAALAQRYKIGKLIGNTSSGTADEVLGINLPGEFNASMVAMFVELPDSKVDFKKGIEPDIKVLPTLESISKGKDEILEYVHGLLGK